MNKRVILGVFLVVLLAIVVTYVVMRGSEISPIHNVAITKVSLSGNEAFEGDKINITVTVENLGNQVENFNVTTYYNATFIERQTITDFEADVNQNLTFVWNTSGVTPANYVIKAEANAVKDETDISDNTYVTGTLRIREKPIEPAMLYVDPDSNTAEIGQSFTISINVSNVIDLYRYELRIRWNSTILNSTSVTQGTFLQSGVPTQFTYFQNNAEGYIIINCTIVGDLPGASGSGILATISFEVKVGGSCALDLYDTIVVSSLEHSIDHTANDGVFTTP